MKILVRILFLALLGGTSLAQAESEDSSWWLPKFWQEEMVPTITNSFDSGGQRILLYGAATTLVSFQYDNTIYEHNLREEDRWLSHKTADFGGWLGSGAPGITIALAQLVWDRDNGVRHGKAIALTAANHILMATAVQRERPSKRNKLSFPSGHASSSFATASSLAYAYGYKAGIPAYAAATFVALARVNENIHWLSDVIAGATLGIYWGRAAALNPGKNTYTIMPVQVGDATLISFEKRW